MKAAQDGTRTDRANSLNRAKNRRIVIRDRVELVASPAMSAMEPKSVSKEMPISICIRLIAIDLLRSIAAMCYI
jgi:hypothetical protein